MASGPEFRPLGAYAARSCPVVTEWDVVQPVEPAPPSALLAGLGEAGKAFEADASTRTHDPSTPRSLGRQPKGRSSGHRFRIVR